MIAISYLPVWLTLDYLADLMYLADMLITVHTGKCVVFDSDFKIEYNSSNSAFIAHVKRYEKKFWPRCDKLNYCYLRIENAEGNVLIAVYLFVCVLFA